jgi:predicted nucleic acid-binding protein
LQSLGDALRDPDGNIAVAPLDAAVAQAVQTISRIAVPDMPDRIIAATALRLNAELVTRDRRLHAALKNRTVW